MLVRIGYNDTRFSIIPLPLKWVTGLPTSVLRLECLSIYSLCPCFLAVYYGVTTAQAFLTNDSGGMPSRAEYCYAWTYRTHMGLNSRCVRETHNWKQPVSLG